MYYLLSHFCLGLLSQVSLIKRGCRGIPAPLHPCRLNPSMKWLSANSRGSMHNSGTCRGWQQLLVHPHSDTNRENVHSSSIPPIWKPYVLPVSVATTRCPSNCRFYQITQQSFTQYIYWSLRSLLIWNWKCEGNLSDNSQVFTQKENCGHCGHARNMQQFGTTIP